MLEVFTALRSAGFEQFRLKGRSFKAANASHFEPSPEAVSRLLARGVNRRDIGKEPIVELGFSFGLWSGGPEAEAYELTGQLGATSEVCSNSLLLTLPESGPHALGVSEQRVRTLFNDLVRILSPADAIVCDVNAILWHKRRLAPNIPCLVRFGGGA